MKHFTKNAFTPRLSFLIEIFRCCLLFIKGAAAELGPGQIFSGEEVEECGLPDLDEVICKACEEANKKVKKELGRESTRVIFELIHI